ncbi:uncharacterized protein K02A2.6-like [Rhipicephalus sanguineus]|uniref:uncharacterized protein K02A2.6-like n=2 Tax=Rhipicephalus sanguineus TaxID=34632 RepID=UPI001893BDDB|nr:uncharacterized protein K02A2.6-like [Rhipicephalus sanguineus]
MRLSLQRFPIKVVYKPGKELFLADALSRFPNQKELKEESLDFHVHALSSLPVSDRQLQEIREEVLKDATMTELCSYSSTEWPESKLQVSETARAYWNYRDELHVEDGLLLRSNKLVIPPTKRQEVLRLLHAAHGGEEKMKARAKAVMYWPGMSADIAALAKACQLCQRYKSRNAKLPMLSPDIPTLPWQVVGIDLFYHEGHEYLVVVDFYSFFFEIKQMHRTTAEAVTNVCMQIFATHGIPAKICSDNGPPFNSTCFRVFSTQLGIIHVTSSPHYPRGNGMAERAVQEAKKLLKKCRFGTLEFYSGLLEWRNMPRDDRLKSPVQRLMGRQTRTKLPVLDCHLEPQTVPTEVVRKRLDEIRRKQRVFYNRSTRNLPEVHSGSTVSVYDTINKTWAPAVVMGPASTPRSYIVATENGQHLRRTREHLRSTNGQVLSQQPESATASAQSSPQPCTTEQQAPQEALRRSARQRRAPQRYPLPECPTQTVQRM